MCQLHTRVGDYHGNAERVVAAVHAVDADIYVFPELCLSGYPLEDELWQPRCRRGIASAVDYLNYHVPPSPSTDWQPLVG